jgi:hypothetical protein
MIHQKERNCHRYRLGFSNFINIKYFFYKHKLMIKRFHLIAAFFAGQLVLARVGKRDCGCHN